MVELFSYARQELSPPSSISGSSEVVAEESAEQRQNIRPPLLAPGTPVSNGIPSAVVYAGASGSTTWEGRRVDDTDGFRAYLLGAVRERVRDADDDFEPELRGLATTEMATEFLASFLTAVPPTEDWEIGEALAECVLREETKHEICWPWNAIRDRRTPRASLPGADLVGFCRYGAEVLLLFGEVKTSSEASSPPNVMYGGSGMTWQLHEEATRLDIQHALLRWLRARCNKPEHIELYRAAVAKYLASTGREILLVGVLVRDTAPNERDLQSRAKHLAMRLPSPTRVELVAWYLPIPIPDWVAVLEGGRS